MKSNKCLQYDKYEFLAAVQASSLYIILLALEPAPVDNNFIQFLLWSTGVRLSSLLSLLPQFKKKKK